MLLVQISFAQSPASLQSKHLNLDEHNLALSGYDPVAYHVQNKAIKGKASYKLTFQKATYYFSSLENKKLFENQPDKYLPAYGGWCAFAMGDTGKKVEVDPETFKMVNGKTHLFYNAYFTNTLTSWNKNEAQLKKQADKNWIKLNQ